MVAIVIGLFIALFVYMDARKRGYGTLGLILWSVGSAMMPYVILPLYFFLGRKNKDRVQYDGNDIIDIEAIVVEDTINCTKCGGEMKEDSLQCPHCQEPTGTDKTDINH